MVASIALVPLLKFGEALLDKFVPNPQEKAKAELEMLKMVQEGELKVILAQLEINAKEAAHPSIFVAGWRPFIGWSSGMGFVYATIAQPLLVWYSTIKSFPVPPAPDHETLMYVLFAILGVGGMRSFEKVKKVAK